MALGKISAKGQVTIPKMIREAVGIDGPCTVVVKAKGNDIIIKKVTGIMDYAGCLGKAATREEERNAVMKYVAERANRRS